jgi:hypothetical protein
MHKLSGLLQNIATSPCYRQTGITTAMAITMRELEIQKQIYALSTLTT